MIKELEKKLKDKQVRPTAMRLLVLDALQKQVAAVSLSALRREYWLK